jgi:cytochrome c biogenesis protein CcdA/thiol-disulfide isomerase/thioredoxin
VIVLLGIGFLAGIVTAISPCVLPVLPILLAGGASGRKPLRIVTGLVASFVVFTLFASWLLSKLGLPQDLLRSIAIALLFVVAATLLVPQLGTLLERPFASLTRHRGGGGGFVLGVSLGLVFVPCAGPVLAAITVVAANNHIGLRALLLTVAYAIGAALPMLAIALGGRRVGARLRTQGARLRFASGVVIALVALGISFHVDDRFATALPGYTQSLQKHIEDNSTARKQLANLRGGTTLVAKKKATSLNDLPDYGVAPALVPGGRWFNTTPLTLRELRGKVVLVDFWTYSCINCLRTLPHLESWYAAYHPKGFVIIGVHTPEFAFEHVASNVGSAIKRLGIRYPVVQDNAYGTWNAYNNQYWPAEFLVDRSGDIRHIHFGESSYSETEGLIRRLLAVRGAMARSVPDLTPSWLATPESYLGYDRLQRYAGSPIRHNRVNAYAFPKTLSQNELAYAGLWRVEAQRIDAGLGARLRLHFVAKHVYLVLGGRGRVDVLLNGSKTGSVNVGTYRLYTLVSRSRPEDATLELRFTPGVKAYAFTFG